MAKRKRVALIYAYNENWIGGTYYIENLIAALAQLPDSEQPELVIFSLEVVDIERLKKRVRYPYWSFQQFGQPSSLLVRALNKLTDIVLGRRFLGKLSTKLDLVFPMPNDWRYALSRYFFSRVPYHLYWIPDFQEHYLPAFFTLEELQSRKASQMLILTDARHLVFSSHAAQDDFKAIYPGSEVNQYVLQFAVTSYSTLEPTAACLARYGITQPYFICSNQFWKHKNHPVVLKALAQLLRTHPQAVVVFTGKEHDYRNATYFEDLMALKEELGVQEQVKFLGFIPRLDQLTLMQAAVAVVQPSLFEGWSTVVEDAKSLQAPLLVSALAVHREQLASYKAKMFFESEDVAGLAACMAEALDGHLPAEPYAYQEDIIRFAQAFMNVVSRILAS